MTDTASQAPQFERSDRAGILIHGLWEFALTLGLAVAAAHKVYRVGTYTPSEPVSAPYFLALFAVMTALVVAILRYTKRGIIFETFFTLAMLSGAWFLADIFFPGPAALLIGSLVIIARFAWKMVFVQNLTLAIGIAGIAASVASSLTVNAVLVVFTVLAFYDIVAVYVSRHMVRMFRDLTSRGVVLAFMLTGLTNKSLLRPADEAMKGNGVLYLGTGDVALPAILAVAAARGGIEHGIAVALGSMAGFILMLSLFFRQDRRRPVPALPPIALGSIIFYFVSLLIFPV